MKPSWLSHYWAATAAESRALTDSTRLRVNDIVGIPVGADCLSCSPCGAHGDTPLDESAAFHPVTRAGSSC